MPVCLCACVLLFVNFNSSEFWPDEDGDEAAQRSESNHKPQSHWNIVHTLVSKVTHKADSNNREDLHGVYI